MVIASPKSKMKGLKVTAQNKRKSIVMTGKGEIHKSTSSEE